MCRENTKQIVTGVCILRELVNLWEQAGFNDVFIVTEQTIKTRITKKVKEYHTLKMLKTLELPEGSYKKRVNTFLKESSALFSINKTNIFDLIKSDKNRDDEAKKEDIKFLRLCLRGDMVKFGNMDNKFCENAHRA